MAHSIDEQIQLLARRCERILTETELRKKLQSSAETGRKLRIKLGMDPTAPDVTLGHCVPLKVIRQFQDFGHKAVLIIGDYTARVGDPSGRDSTRPILSGEQIDANARTYVAQLGKVLLTDADHLEVRWNGEWLGALNLVDLIRLAGRKSVAQMLERDSFKERFERGDDIRIHELLYPLLQGWDSVVVRADVEMGGSDQLFNNLVGREFQKEEGQEPQVVMVTPLLVGTDGKMKMSKSKGNYIAVTDPPGGADGMFGKVMRLPDALLENYYTLLTDLPPEEFKPAIAANPRDAKVALGKFIVTWLHGPVEADRAQADFYMATHDALPSDYEKFPVARGAHWLPGLLRDAKLAASSSEARRKIEEGAVHLFRLRQPDDGIADTQQLKSPKIELILGEPGGVVKTEGNQGLHIEEPFVLRVGKRFAKIVF